MSMSMRASVRSSRKARAKEEKEKEESRIGVYLVMTTGSQKVASMDTIVQGIIPDDNQEDVQYATSYFSVRQTSQAKSEECRVIWEQLARRRRMATRHTTKQNQQQQSSLRSTTGLFRAEAFRHDVPWNETAWKEWSFVILIVYINTFLMMEPFFSRRLCLMIQAIVLVWSIFVKCIS